MMAGKQVFATPEVTFGFHTDCGFSYRHSRLPGHLGEFLALTGARLIGKEIVAAGFATHFVSSEKIVELEKHLISLNSGDENAVRSVIEEFSSEIELAEESILNKKSIIDECFSKDSVEEIIKSLEAESSKEGNGWIGPVLKGLKRTSPTALKIELRSVREGRNETLGESLKKDFRLTMNILRTTISGDMYEKMALGGAGPQRGSAAAAASLRRRRTTSGGASGGAAGTMLQFYTDDAPGLKISPNVVLVMSIGFIAFVAILHVMGKLYFREA